MNRDDWNAKYAGEGLVWGVRPNTFVAAETEGLPPGRALDLACGEGRNAVWLAEQGWQVTGIDFAEAAVERAARLAQERRVAVDLRVEDVLVAPLEAGSYDLVLIAYLQLPAGERRVVLDHAVTAVAPGGVFLLVAHDLRNATEGYGGPSNPGVLWTAVEAEHGLAERGFVVERAGEVLRHVDGAPRPAIDTLVRARRPAVGEASLRGQASA